MLQDIEFTLNSRPVHATVGSHENAIDVLRRFDLFGARESCGQGLCGCCTIRVNSRPLSGCLTLALKLDGAVVETIEGLDVDGKLDPVQEAFIEQGAFQCGFCTPGFVMMAKELLREQAEPDDDQIRSYLSGNLCRCAAYPEIVKAVKEAGKKLAAARA